MGRGAIQSRLRQHLGKAACALCVLAVAASALGWHVTHATDPGRVEPIELPEHLALQDGDIVLAGGVSMQSRAVMSLAGGQVYSHVGLVEVRADGIYIIHASPKGAGDGGGGERVSRLPLAVFLSERGYVRLAVLRLHEDVPDRAAVIAAATAYGAQAADRAVPFDHRYDLADSESLYCSELVWLAYAQAGLAWEPTLMTELSLTRADGPVILPGSFLQSSLFSLCWESSPPPKGTP